MNNIYCTNYTTKAIQSVIKQQPEHIQHFWFGTRDTTKAGHSNENVCPLEQNWLEMNHRIINSFAYIQNRILDI